MNAARSNVYQHEDRTAMRGVPDPPESAAGIRASHSFRPEVTSAAGAPRCGNCALANPADRKFCAGCGKPVTQPCLKCGAPLGTAEVYCGGCGAHQQELIKSHLDRAKQVLASAEEAAGREDYREAVALLRAARSPKHSSDFRLADVCREVDERARRYAAELERLEALSRDAQQLAAAAMERRDYAEVIQRLEPIPATLRDPAMSRLLQRAQGVQVEIRTLAAEIREMVAAKKILDLAPRLEKLLTLDPRHAHAQQLSLQVRERLHQAAEKYLTEHRYDLALGVLGRVPGSARDATTARLTDQAAELNWLLQELQSAPYADAPLLSLAQRLLKLAPQERLQPLAEKLKSRLAGRVADPRLPGIPWAEPPEQTPFGCPVDWLGGFRSVTIPDPRVEQLVRQAPGQLATALGLALQVLGRTELDVNLIPRKRGGVLQGLGLGARKKPVRSAWGIDLGTSSLKAVKLSQDSGDKPPHLEAFFECKLDAQATTLESAAPWETTLGTLFTRLLQANPLGRDEKVGISFPGQRVLGRFFRAPPTDPKKMTELLHYEARHQIPYPLEELALDFHTFPQGSGDQRAPAVLLVAAKRLEVQEFLRRCEESGLHVDVLQSDCVALHNFLRHEFAGEQGLRGENQVICLLDIGAATTNVVLGGPSLIWFRSLRLGGEEFTKALAAEFQLTNAQAEQLKRDPARAPLLNADFRVHRAAAAFQPLFEQLQGEIQRSFEASAKVFDGPKVAQLYGLGGGIRVPGLMRFLRLGR